MKPVNPSKHTPATTRRVDERDRSGSSVPPEKRKEKRRAINKAARKARRAK